MIIKHPLLAFAVLGCCLSLPASASPKAPVPQTEQRQTATQDNQFPPRPAKVNGRVSCNTRCINSQCWRTYDNGRKVRFQARQKINPFTNQLEWDAGPC